MRSKIHLLLFVLLLGCNHTASKEDGDGSLHISDHGNKYLYSHGAIVRGDTTKKSLSLVFTGDEFADGGMHIINVLDRQQVPGSFFLTGKFYRNSDFASLIGDLVSEGHYLGAHSDQHLLYCDWENRDSLLVTREEFFQDLENNYLAMKQFGIQKENAHFFLPPYEWYNDTIGAWTRTMNLQLINYSYGTLSHADYTLPGTPGYRSSEFIYQSVIEYEKSHSGGLNGFILLSHIGTAPERTDKVHLTLEELIVALKSLGYRFNRIDELLPL